MAGLNSIFNFLTSNILTRAELFVGLIILLGYILQRKKWYECVGGFFKGVIGYLILMVGANGLITTFLSLIHIQMCIRDRFGVALVGAVLGSRLGTTATLVYVLLGAIGLPIFANFSGGISSIVGVTGGYIWAWPIMTWLCGIRPKTENKTKKMCIRDRSSKHP